jgi:hypothetical protein
MLRVACRIGIPWWTVVEWGWTSVLRERDCYARRTTVCLTGHFRSTIIGHFRSPTRCHFPKETSFSYFGLFWHFFKINLAIFSRQYVGVTLCTLTQIDARGMADDVMPRRRLAWLSRANFYGVTCGPASFHCVSTSHIRAVGMTQSHQIHWRNWWADLIGVSLSFFFLLLSSLFSLHAQATSPARRHPTLLAPKLGPTLSR